MDFFLSWFTIILCFFATNQNHQYFDWLRDFTWAREMYLYLPALLSLSHAWKSSSTKMLDLLIMIVLVITMKINSYEYNTCNPRWTIAATSSLLTWVITNTLQCIVWEEVFSKKCSSLPHPTGRQCREQERPPWSQSLSLHLRPEPEIIDDRGFIPENPVIFQSNLRLFFS